MRLEAGQTVDRFEILSPLGAGATSLVYRARDRQTDQVVALKVLSVFSPAIRERMVREGELQKRLLHPNIVRLVDALQIDGNPALAFELIEGPSLERALTRYHLGLADGELLFLGIVAGVRHAHAHGQIHRDLKPGNVLLARTSDGFVPKVTDFGLAKNVRDAERPGVAQTRNGIAMGTPAYMAPEQIRDAGRVDHRADLFSLGCILYEITTGKRAFPDDDILAIYNAVDTGAYTPPRALLPDLPDRVDLAIRGCLLTDPDLRIPDCDTLIQVLQGARTWEVTERPRARALTPLADERPPPAARTDIGWAEGAAIQLDPASSDGAVASMPPAPSLAGTLDPDPAPRAWWPVAVAGAILAIALLIGLGVVLGAVVYTRTRPEAAAPAEPPAAAVAPTAPPQAPAPAPPPAPAADRSPVAPDRAPTTAPRAAPVEPRGAPAPAPAEARPPAPAPPAATPEAVTVRLLTVPPTATVTVDGAPRGRSPAKLDLPPGRHAVTVRGATTGAFVIDAKPGADNKWCYAFADGQVHAGACP